MAENQTDGYNATWIPGYTKPVNLDPYMHPAAHEEKYNTRNEWATSPQMYHTEIMDDYVTNVSKNLSGIPYAGNLLAAGAELGAPIASGILSLPYDIKQAVDDWETQNYSSLGNAFKGLFFPGGTIDHQNPLSSLWYRTKGSLKPIGRRIKDAVTTAQSARAGASGRRPGSGGGGGTRDSGGPTGGYSYDAGGRQGYGYGLAHGGLATMFQRR